jgi:CheY-like chemotaxis protein
VLFAFSCLVSRLKARYILKRHGEGAPPIIAMTANMLSENERECAQAGMKDFVSKPFTFGRLEDIIQKWI